MKPLIIFGAGGHAKAIIATAQAAGNPASIVAVDDPHGETSLLGVPILAAEDVAALEGFRFVVAIGDAKVRRAKFDWLLSLGGEPETIIHPRAYVSDFVQIGRGTVIFSMATIDPCVTIGENCIVNVCAGVGHDCVIGNDCHVSANAIICGNCNIGEGSFVGPGSAIGRGVTVGDGCMIGMGAIVSHDVPAHHKAVSPHRKDAVMLAIGT